MMPSGNTLPANNAPVENDSIGQEVAASSSLESQAALQELVPVHQLETVSEQQDNTELPGNLDALVFDVPVRNWQRIITDYHSFPGSKRFPLTHLQCAAAIERVKRGTPVAITMRALGVSNARLTSMMNLATQCDETVETLRYKGWLDPTERDIFQRAFWNPYRLFMLDIAMCESIAALTDFDTFDREAKRNPDLLVAKMKAYYKDIFDKGADKNAGVNVQINLGGDWVKDI